MSETTEKTLAEQKTGSLTLLLDFEQGLETLKAKLHEPISGAVAIELARKFCNDSAVKYIATQAFGEPSLTNSQLVQRNLTLMAKDTPFNNVAVDLKETLVMLTTHCGLHLKAAVEYVNHLQDDDKALALRKDVYRLNHASNIYYDDQYITPATVDNIPCGEDEGAYLMDDDIIGTAEKALERFVIYSDLADTCLDRVEYFANRYRMVLNFLELFHARFLSYLPKPDDA